jgi:hypothetical protein
MAANHELRPSPAGPAAIGPEAVACALAAAGGAVANRPQPLSLDLDPRGERDLDREIAATLRRLQAIESAARERIERGARARRIAIGIGVRRAT